MALSTGMHRLPLVRRFSGKRSIYFGLGLALAALVASGFARTDSLVERGFAEALQHSAISSDLAPTKSAPIAGSEDFWLTHASNTQAAATGGEVSLALWPSKVRLGTSVEISLGGRPVSFEVVDFSVLPSGTTHVSTVEGSENLVVVSLREFGKADGAVLRIIVEAAEHGDGEIAVRKPQSL